MSELVHCPHCGHEYQYVHRVGEPAPTCPECGSKYYTPPSIAFHGSGFYSTDSVPRDTDSKD